VVIGLPHRAKSIEVRGRELEQAGSPKILQEIGERRQIASILD
jgi:hypothetical protein